MSRTNFPEADLWQQAEERYLEKSKTLTEQWVTLALSHPNSRGNWFNRLPAGAGKLGSPEGLLCERQGRHDLQAY